MKIVVVQERASGEARVAVSAETAAAYVGLGVDLWVQAGAGAGAGVTDSAYGEAGAKVASGDDLLAGTDVLLCVNRPSGDVWRALSQPAVIVGMLDPWSEQAQLREMCTAGHTGLSLEFLPRISRAQSMDVLSSQANLAGYRAVIEAAARFTRATPMMMTAAGAVAPAKVFVMGAGVAGLQAIATAGRLGAVVTATDVRPAAKEQVASLGARFVAVEDEEFRAAETAAGYAKPMSQQYMSKQSELVAQHIARQDIVITTALIPGRAAPRLVSSQMLASMAAGSVVVDMAVTRGGNVEGSVAGEVVNCGGVLVVGADNLASQVAGSASRLYAKNLLNLLSPLIVGGSVSQEAAAGGDGASGRLHLDLNKDEQLIAPITLFRDGKVVNEVLEASAS